MQSRPESQNVLYVAFNGHQIVGPAIPAFLIGHAGWVGDCNVFDIDSSYIGLDPTKWIGTLNVPPPKPGQITTADIKEIFDGVVKKLEPFDINVTTDYNVFKSAPGRKYIVIVTSQPDANEFNTLLSINDKTENNPFPYSYRRWFLSDITVSEMNQRYYKKWASAGVSDSYVQQVFVNPFYNNGPESLISFAFTNGASSLSVPIPLNPNPSQNLLWQGGRQWTQRYSNIGIIQTIVHELGHLFLLDHDGSNNQRYPEYYKGHDVWAPIMGSSNEKLLQQWDKGEYSSSTRKNQNDVDIINSNIRLLKTPKPGTKPYQLLSDLVNFEKEEWPQELGYNIRNITSSDVKYIEGKGNVIEGIFFNSIFHLINLNIFKFYLLPLSMTINHIKKFAH